jgi:hypothetical protein
VARAAVRALRLCLLPLWLGAWAASCNVYEGRTLELFPATLGQGLGCETERDCPKDKGWCARGECVQCLVDADCGPARAACVGNQCVACRTQADCPANQDCNPVLYECAARCTQPSDCAGLPTTQCSSELDLCVQCLDDAHCRAPKDPACDRGGRCVECTQDGHCSGSRSHCNVELRRCAECVSDADCGSGVCDARDGKCVECVGDGDCPAGTCDPGPRRCRVPCGEGVACDPKHPICDEAAGMCVECLRDEQCTMPGKPVCVTATQRCGECVSDAQCAESMRCELEEARCAPAPKDPMMMPPRP